MNETNKIYQNSIQLGVTALVLILKQYLEKQIELERIVRVAVLLKKNGVNQNNFIYQKIIKRCLNEQKDDGGWIGVEDSIWCTAFLKNYEEYSQSYNNGLKWLKTQQLQNGEWGKTDRDIGRIPITGTLLYLLPELSNSNNITWLKDKWKVDFNLNPKLTYKGAFALMAFKKSNHSHNMNFLQNILNWLSFEQNDDYGWGYFHEHPMGSNPFSTGVAITGLLQYPDKINKNIINNGLQWIIKNQLKEGLWSDHYIEEGSIWVFNALSEGYKFLTY